MLASLDVPPIAHHGLLYEPKYDGIRALVDLRPAHGPEVPHVAIYSRNGHDKTRQFPAIAASLARIARTLDAPVLMDGEIVATDAAGTPLGFERIQGRIHLTSDVLIARAEQAQPAALMLFDLLRDGDEDLRPLPLANRRLRLQARLRITPAVRKLVRLSELVADDGTAMLKRAKRERWEGLIVKDGQSPYHSGRRTPAWRKLKLLAEQELVVIGWTEPRLSRQHFGALLLGYFEKRARGSSGHRSPGPSCHLIFAGSVGTGFDDAELARLAARLAPLEVAKCPCDAPIKTAETPHWVKPQLVIEVRFTEWTSDGLLRQPVYLGTRDDKLARQVVREMPRATASGGPGLRTRPERQASTLAAPRSLARSLHREPTSVIHRQPPSVIDREPTSVVEQLAALEDARRDGTIALPNGDTLRVTNLRKVFWPTLGITKGELLRYYAEIAPLILPAVADRPLVMKRSPNGVGKPAFYQQRHPEPAPSGVRREALPESIDPLEEAEGGHERLIGGSLTTLLYMTQLGAISQDPWFSRVADPRHQDYAAIDLDPGDGATFAGVLDVARWVKDELDRFHIPGVPKTSGSSGLHIYIPLPKNTTYETGQLLCQVIATIVATRHPQAATVERMVKKRPRGAIYIDYLQNILGKTLATAYSARATDYAGVSTPLTWKEVDAGVDPHDFTIRTAPTRFRAVGDLWARLRTGKTVDLKAVIRKMR
jgi:bifunctional non-homologous end joining protein LigD